MYIYTTSLALQEERYLRRVTERRPTAGSDRGLGRRQRLLSLRTLSGRTISVGRIRRQVWP